MIIRKKLLLSVILLAFGLISLMPNDASAARKGKGKYELNMMKEKGSNSWYGELAPYLWFPGFNGHMSSSTSNPVFGIDNNFEDFVDDIEFTIALNASVKKGKWGWYGDLYYLRIDSDWRTSVSGEYAKVALTLDQVIFTNALTYTLYNEEWRMLEIMAGARTWYLNHDSDIYLSTGTLSTSGDEIWADPFIGLRSQFELSRRWYISLMANAGGFKARSDETYEAFSGIGFRFNKRSALRAGFKYLSVDYNKDGFLYNMKQKGSYVGYFLFF